MKELLQMALDALEAALSDDQPYIERCKDAITALREALAAPQPEPSDMVMVPREPTQAMCAAAVVFANGNAVYKNVLSEVLKLEESIYAEVYEAMIAAAPAPVVPLTDERLQKHAMRAGDCPPGSMVVLLSSLRRMLSAAPVVPLTARELELIDGMIEVQLHHAKQCDGIANRTMAEKQKGWDMERVELLRKMRGIGGGGK